MNTVAAILAAATAASPTLSLDAAIAAYEASPPVAEARHFSYWRSDINGVRGEYRENLTTTTASGYTCALDWLAKAMGAGPSTAFANAQGFATSVTATSLTNSGATFPTAGQGLAGCLVVACPNNAGTGSKVYAVVVSNTGTALTVDQWYDPTSTSGAAGTTPNGTCSYVILPGQNPAAWLALSATVHTPATSDTTLSGELTSGGLARAVGTYSHTAAATTYALTFTWTSTSTNTIINEAQFGACNTTAGGVMPFTSAEPNSPALSSGDTLQNTITVTI